MCHKNFHKIKEKKFLQNMFKYKNITVKYKNFVKVKILFNLIFHKNQKNIYQNTKNVIYG